jgi:Arc/MetJ-type ribon-helix-helix transcriptional regulator
MRPLCLVGARRKTIDMNTTLHPDVQEFVEEKVKTGEYKSPEEAINGLLSRVRSQEELTPEDIADLRAELDPALAEADRREFAGEDVIAERIRC